MFGPTAIRIHPIFTQIKDWAGDTRPDGVEALLEFTDAFGDPTKASGQVIFELYTYRRSSPDPRGQRVGGPWAYTLNSLTAQRRHWKRIGAAYSFQLPFVAIGRKSHYVLTAQWTPIRGDRMFDQIVLVPPEAEDRPLPTEEPSRAPSTRPAD